MGQLRTRKWSDEDTLIKKKKSFTVQIHISSCRENLDRPHYRVVRQLKSPVGVDLGETDVYKQVLVRYHFWVRSPQKMYICHMKSQVNTRVHDNVKHLFGGE
jgi:hypothetical protein